MPLPIPDFPTTVDEALRLARTTVTFSADQDAWRVAGDLRDELSRRAAAAGILADEVSRFREHSILLNQVAWKIAQALGRVPDGATAVEGDVLKDLAALIDRARR